MKINRERCTDCGLCIEACPAEAVSYQDGHVEISEELCLNVTACSASQICPPGAIERVEPAKEAVRCVIGCPVQCEIRPGKVGECRMFSNVDGKIVRTVSPVSFESVKEMVGPEYDEVVLATGDKTLTPLVAVAGAVSDTVGDFIFQQEGVFPRSWLITGEI